MNRQAMVGGAASSLVFFSLLAYGGEKLWFEFLIFGAVFLLCCFPALRGGLFPDEATKRRLFLPLILLAFYSFLQAFLTIPAEREIISRTNILPYSFDPAAGLKSGFKILAFAAFIRLIQLASADNKKTALRVLFFAVNFFAVFAVVRFAAQSLFPGFFRYFFLPQLTPGTGFGTFLNQNHFALLMLMTYGLNLGLLRFGGLNKTWRFGLLLLTLLSWTAIVLTASRGGIISSFLVTAVFVFPAAENNANTAAKTGAERSVERHRTGFQGAGRKLAVFAFVSVVLTAGIVFIGQDRVLRRFEELPSQFESAGPDSSGFRRLDAWEAGLLIAKENWLYGVGFGGYKFAVSKFIDISGRTAPREAHNDYLEFFNSAGLAGTALGLWFLYNFVSVSRKNLREDAADGSVLPAVRVGAACGLAGVALHSFFDFGLQFTGNLLTCAALVGILTFDGRRATKKQKPPAAGEFFLCGALLFFCLCAVIFGVSRYRLEKAARAINPKAFDGWLLAMPFDAGYFEARSRAEEFSGDAFAALKSQEKAVRRRPKDYALHLRLARLAEKLNRTDEAENGFRRAVELAPLYGEPHFYYGRFLLTARSQKTNGFNELLFAFRRDLQFAEKTLEILWAETGADAVQTAELLFPLDKAEREKAFRFFAAKKEYAAMAAVACKNDLTQAEIDRLVIQLLEKRQYRHAWRIFRRDCRETDFAGAQLIDGDFESGEILKGTGFGWRAGDEMKGENVRPDTQNFSSGRRSLKFIIDGFYNGPLISQIVPAAENASYEFSFFHKSGGKSICGAPVLQIIARSDGAGLKLSETPLTAAPDAWQKTTVDFQMPPGFQALEFRLKQQIGERKTCPQPDVFWIDNAFLTKK